mmetsp:Transcript_9330/g.28262  ORF Transcript_9330/g.28262 Transcript_9330/m.28262 type:complete len:309 (+) Transcript_9330:376-1302(+)|eukprot:scaffold201584_cov26-Tisochrysis_lutea.AAC.1
MVEIRPPNVNRDIGFSWPRPVSAASYRTSIASTSHSRSCHGGRSRGLPLRFCAVIAWPIGGARRATASLRILKAAQPSGTERVEGHRGGGPSRETCARVRPEHSVEEAADPACRAPVGRLWAAGKARCTRRGNGRLDASPMAPLANRLEHGSVAPIGALASAARRVPHGAALVAQPRCEVPIPVVPLTVREDGQRPRRHDAFATDRQRWRGTDALGAHTTRGRREARVVARGRPPAPRIAHGVPAYAEDLEAHSPNDEGAAALRIEAVEECGREAARGLGGALWAGKREVSVLQAEVEISLEISEVVL